MPVTAGIAPVRDRKDDSLQRAIAAAVSLVVLVAGPPDAVAQTQDDAKVWAGFTGGIELAPKLRLDVEQQARAGAAEGFERTFTEVGLRLRVHKHLRFGGGYRFIVTANDGIWHRGAADVRLRYRFKPTTLSYRLRLQSTSRNDGTRTAVRNRVRASYDVSKSLAPFAALELHYLTTNSEFREARVYFGLDVAVTRDVGVRAFYMFQSEFNKSVDESNHIFGIAVDYRIRRVKKPKLRTTTQARL